MSLIRQIWLLLLMTLVLAFGASVGVTVTSARSTLQTQLRLKNADNAASLALALSQQKGDRALLELLLAAQFDTGFYQRIRYLDASGAVALVREAPAAPGDAPQWFIDLLPIASEPGVAQVSDGWRALGQIEVVSQTAYAHDQLWRGSMQAASALGVVGLLAALAGAFLVGRIRRPLDATVAQARALVEGEFIRVAEPRVPELRRLTQAMNTMVQRLRVTFAAQAEQVELLRRQANCDRLTGLSNRAHFLGRLSTTLQREDGTADGGLLLLRVLDLAGVNRDAGHAATDHLIVTIAQALRPYPERVDGCFLGRLNGSDFALSLPVAGMAEETAYSLLTALRLVLASVVPGSAVCIGAVETQRGMALSEVMAGADAALARAESRGPYAVEVGAGPGASLHLRGEGAWRQRIGEALEQRRLRLVEFPLLDARGALVHLECPLRVQLEADGPFEPAARWLPLALRSRLTAELDERALALALAQTAIDRRPRGINLAPASLADAGFAGRLRSLLSQDPDLAQHLWIEIAEGAAVEQFDALRELVRQLRPTGIRFGLEHAGERLASIPRLIDLGIDYVKLDASVVVGLAADAHRRAFVQSSVTLVHSLALKAYAEGVADAADAQALWDCGIDAITGPIVGEYTPTTAGSAST
ncbi:MAG: EAL domain-containing protein [Burkholderiaceae bacterium]